MPKVVIIGNGPAGISAALYVVRSKMDVVVIGKGDSALKKAHKIDNYYGTGSVTGEELFQNGIKQAKDLGVQFAQEEVVGIGYGENLEVTTVENEYSADAVIIATGTARKTPNIEGISRLEGKGVSYCAVCDGFFFRGKTVGVLGDGQYAVHEAKELQPIVGEVTIFSNGKEIQNAPDDIKINKSKITEVLGEDSVEKIVTADGEIQLDGLFVAEGIADSFGLARKLGAEVSNNRIVVNENMETNIPGLYAAGDCTGGMLQVSKAVYEGAKAGTEAVKYIREKNK